MNQDQRYDEEINKDKKNSLVFAVDCLDKKAVRYVTV